VAKKESNAQFIADFYKYGGIEPMARALGVDRRGLQRKRKRVEDEEGIALEQTNRPELTQYLSRRSRQRMQMALESGTVIIGSDAHYLPGEATIAHRAFVEAVKGLKPTLVILNGDIADFAQISRHDRMGWQSRFKVKDEIDAIQLRMSEIEAAHPGATRVLTKGNHGERLDSRLAQRVPEYEGVSGLLLEAHLPAWKHTMSLMLNDDVMVKHSWHSGVHGAWNNVLKAGISMFTGHTHRLTIREYSDYRGVRYGVETGMLADPDDEQFDYALDGLKNWQPGFIVCTFRKGVLLPPERCEVVRDVGAAFRGTVIVPE